MASTDPSGSRSGHGAGAALAAAMAAVALALLAVMPAAGSSMFGTVEIVDATAGHEVIVDGEPHVCDFFFNFDLNIHADIVGWEVKTFDAEPLNGTTVLKGKGGPTDADGRLRQPDSGTLSVPDGHYNVVWDDEDPVDSSNGHESFVVDCANAAPAPATPTPTPTQNAQPIGGTGPTPTPTGEAEAAVGAPAVTLPPTDTNAADRGGTSPIGILVGGLVLLGACVWLLSPRRLARRRAR